MLLVGRDFPQSGSFAVAEPGEPLMIRVEIARRSRLAGKICGGSAHRRFLREP